MKKNAAFDAADYLDNDLVIAEYLDAALEDENPNVCLQTIADKARNLSSSLALACDIDRVPSPSRSLSMANNEKNNPNRHDTADHAEQKKGEDSYKEDLRKAQEVDPAQGADVRRDHLDPAGQPPRPEEDQEKQVGGQRR